MAPLGLLRAKTARLGMSPRYLNGKQWSVCVSGKNLQHRLPGATHRTLKDIYKTGQAVARMGSLIFAAFLWGATRYHVERDPCDRSPLEPNKLAVHREMYRGGIS